MSVPFWVYVAEHNRSLENAERKGADYSQYRRSCCVNCKRGSYRFDIEHFRYYIYCRNDCQEHNLNDCCDKFKTKYPDIFYW